MKNISCLLGHILLPAGFGLSGQKFLHLHTVFTDCPMRGSADSKLHVSREREHKQGSRIVSWHHDIALAQDQQPDGQLPISSKQVEADHSAIFPTLFSLRPLLSSLSLSYSSDHPPLRTSPWGPSPGPPQGPVKARWHSQRLCLYVSVSAPSQTTSHRPTRAAGLRLSYWLW